jgi:hypothetical protein
MPSIGDVILDINRPQYVSVPEGFISSLAWTTYDWDAVSESGKPLGLVFRSRTKKISSNFEVRETGPKGDEHEGFGRVLRTQGLGHDAVSNFLLSEAVSNSVTGVQAEKSTLQAASPVTPGFALLQNVRGVQQAKNPPDLAGILESLYSFGQNMAIGGSPSGVAERWKHASKYRCSKDPLLLAMDRAVREQLVGHGIREREAAPPRSTAYYPNSPFTWFARSWDKLTSEDWVDALPARVWTDWATTILRLAMGMGFLWEAVWYETLARRVLSNEPSTWEQTVSSVPQVLPWKSSRASFSVRDVASILVWRVHKGGGVRKVLIDWIDHEIDPETDFAPALIMMQNDDRLVNALTAARGSQQHTSPNTWEAIKYALKTRDAAGPFADYYGLLRSSGRFLTVEPGTEWIAVVASLACKTPGGQSNVGELMADLTELGMQPELSDVVTLLERAGLARGSADADQGVQIQSAF